jgi:hypothetical protein
VWCSPSVASDVESELDTRFVRRQPSTVDRPELRGCIGDALDRHDRDARDRDEAASKVTVEEIVDAVGGGSPRRGAAHDSRAGAGEPDDDHVTAGRRDSPRPGTRAAPSRRASNPESATGSDRRGGIECFDLDGLRTRTDLRTVSDLGCGGRGVGRGQNRLSDRRATQRVFRARVLDFARTRLGMAAPPGDRATVCRARG